MRASIHVGRLCLVVVTILGLVLPMLDPEAAGRSPWHEHIVIGAHGLEEWAHAMMTHHHGGADRSEDLPPDGNRPDQQRAGARPCGIRVIAIHESLDGNGTAAFGIYTTALTCMDGAVPLAMPDRGDQVIVAEPHPPSSLPASVPEPPPRAFS